MEHRTHRTHTLCQLVTDSQYIIDERVVAEAILVRAQARRLVPGIRFRNDVVPPARPFDVPVRSFRLCGSSQTFRRTDARRVGAHRVI
jgi:hypothetical protein